VSYSSSAAAVVTAHVVCVDNQCLGLAVVVCVCPDHYSVGGVGSSPGPGYRQFCVSNSSGVDAVVTAQVLVLTVKTNAKPSLPDPCPIIKKWLVSMAIGSGGVQRDGSVVLQRGSRL